MLNYSFILSTDRPAQEVQRAMDALVPPDLRVRGLLTYSVKPPSPQSASFHSGLLAAPATVQVFFAWNAKVEWSEAERAQQTLAIACARVAHDCDARALLSADTGPVAMRRTDGLLYLYEWFLPWLEPHVQAAVPQPWILTADQDAGRPEGADKP